MGVHPCPPQPCSGGCTGSSLIWRGKRIGRVLPCAINKKATSHPCTRNSRSTGWCNRPGWWACDFQGRTGIQCREAAGAAAAAEVGWAGWAGLQPASGGAQGDGAPRSQLRGKEGRKGSFLWIAQEIPRRKVCHPHVYASQSWGVAVAGGARQVSFCTWFNPARCCGQNWWLGAGTWSLVLSLTDGLSRRAAALVSQPSFEPQCRSRHSNGVPERIWAVARLGNTPSTFSPFQGDGSSKLPWSWGTPASLLVSRFQDSGELFQCPTPDKTSFL